MQYSLPTSRAEPPCAMLRPPGLGLKTALRNMGEETLLTSSLPRGRDTGVQELHFEAENYMPEWAEVRAVHAILHLNTCRMLREEKDFMAKQTWLHFIPMCLNSLCLSLLNRKNPKVLQESQNILTGTSILECKCWLAWLSNPWSS